MKKVIASILTIVLSIPIFVSTPLANTVSQSTTTGYGSYYFTYNNDLDTFLLQLGNLGGVNMKGYCQSLIYEFNDSYSGYLDVHLLSQSIWQNATIITENCYVKGKNSSTWDYSIGFKDVTSIKVTLVLPTLTTNNAWSGNKMALTNNYNITRDVTTVDDYLEDINTTLGTIDAQLGTMTTSLSNIYGVENASRQLLAEIEYAIRGDNSLYVLSNDMGTIITDLNSIISTVNNMNMYGDLPYYSYQAYRIFNAIGDLGDFQAAGVTSTYQKAIYMKYGRDYTYDGNYSIMLPPGETMHVIAFFSTNTGENRVKMVTSNGTTYNFNANIILNLNNFFLIDYYYKNNTSGNLWVQIAPATTNYRLWVIPVYVGYHVPYELSNDLNIVEENPITTGLANIVNAINNMSVNVNNLTVNATGITYNVNNTQVNNSVNNYNTQINQVYNVENNFGTTLDQQLLNYNPDNTSIISRLTASGNIMATVLNGINGIELFTVPIGVMLVGIVLLAIVG